MTQRDIIIEHFRAQIGWCEALGSPFTAQLITVLHQNIVDGGMLDDMLRDWRGEPTMDALSLRVAGALQALVRAGKTPDLAALYPDVQRPVTADDLRAPVLAALADHRAAISEFLTYAVQTNEVGRSSVLLPGFAHLARQFDLPFSLYEMGASAGLNMIWDQFHYDFGNGHLWGDPDSPVHFDVKWEGPFPALPPSFKIARRQAVDINPLDIHNGPSVDRVRSYIWPDQTARITRFEGAIALAKQAGIQVEQGDAGDWVAAHLTDPQPGRLRVLYHSIMWQYPPEETRQRIINTMRQAGDAATPDAPLGWMNLEPLDATATLPTLNVRLWDGRDHDGTLYQLAHCHPHGGHLVWFDEPKTDTVSS
ncbi:MAG: DUF2332 domain-containing protein [Alphaproteobacteria bacterium]